MTGSRARLHTALAAVHHIPGSAAAARWLPPRQALRSVLFHQIADEPSPFTEGLDVRVTAGEFADLLGFLRERYTFVDLDEVLAGTAVRSPLLLTFDDAYRGVLEVAAPLCAANGLPAVFFVNGSLVGNRTLSIDNLVTYAVNVRGMGVVERAAGRRFGALADVVLVHLATLTLAQREAFRRRLIEAADLDPAALAAGAGLYVDEAQLAGAAAQGVEVANHTWSHAHCGALEAGELAEEVAGNRAWLERVTARPVRAFSYPYGRHAGAPAQVRRLITEWGHDLSFFAESYANPRAGAPHVYDRVTLGAASPAQTFSAVELRPRVRAARRRLSSA